MLLLMDVLPIWAPYPSQKILHGIITQQVARAVHGVSLKDTRIVTKPCGKCHGGLLNGLGM